MAGFFNEAERGVMPPEERCLFCPDCGNEVYEGEVLYRFGYKSGKRHASEDKAETVKALFEGCICGRCLAKEIAQLPPEEIAWLAGIKGVYVSFAPERTVL